MIDRWTLFVVEQRKKETVTEYKPYDPKTKETKQNKTKSLVWVSRALLLLTKKMTDSGHDIEIRCHHCAGPLTRNLVFFCIQHIQIHVADEIIDLFV